ncbi:MAG: 4'-phosphopantetheinyl transferase family protein [Rhodomicrobiaceae bacterium]
MNRHDDSRVKDLFSASVRDRTPAPVRHEVSVLYAPASSDGEVTSRCASVLSDGELERAGRFLTEASRAGFIQRRAFRRYCAASALGASQPLSQFDFKETEKGRPYLPDLPDLWFSFSACRLGFLGAWARTSRIGVDIEDPARPIEAADLAQRYFSRNEAIAVEAADERSRAWKFYQLWSLKEAALKSIGEGLPFGLDAFQFELGAELRLVEAPADHGGPERFTAHLIGEGDDCAALMIRNAG